MPADLNTSPTVARVVRGELCTGCGLCASVAGGAIEIQSLPPGYNRPVVRGPVGREAERVIAATCPGAVVSPWTPDADPLWGPMRRIATGAAVDDAIRFEGSSGGAISALLVHALRSGVVDRVLHIAADPSDPTRNATVISRTADEIIARAGSRYTASSPLAQIDAALAEGGRMAFVGKPCDASALRELAARDARVERHVPLILSFFCGGIPSHAGVGRILKTMRMEGQSITEFRFRGRGWPGDCVATGPEGEGRMSYADSWGGHLSREVQFRCKICPDAVGGVADIACADAWYGDDNGYPSFAEEEGRSLIIARTAAGEALLESTVAAGVLSTSPLAAAEIAKMQPSQARRKRLILARVAALPLLLQPWPKMAGLKVGKAARSAPVLEALRNLLGTMRRTLAGRRSQL